MDFESQKIRNAIFKINKNINTDSYKSSQKNKRLIIILLLLNLRDYQTTIT